MLVVYIPKRHSEQEERLVLVEIGNMLINIRTTKPPENGHPWNQNKCLAVERGVRFIRF